MDDQIRKALAAKIDRDILTSITGTSTAAPSEPLTLDKLREVMLALPPTETWLSSKVFPVDRAWRVKGSGENFTCAHPGFWMRIENHLRKGEEVKPVDHNDNIFAMHLTPIEIDPWEDDGPETAAWRRGYWRRLTEAVSVAMVPLPDWLRSAPQFGKFG